MLAEPFITLIKKHIYVIHQENFHSIKSDTYLIRLVAKHPLLRPEIIIKNDEPQGFKKSNKDVKSLEGFPIYVEIEGEMNDGNYITVDHIDLYAEAYLSPKDRLSDIIYLAKHFENSILIDRLLRMANPDRESISIYSKINESVPLDEEDDENQAEVIDMFNTYLFDFVKSIQCVNDVIAHKKTIAKLQSERLC